MQNPKDNRAFFYGGVVNVVKHIMLKKNVVTYCIYIKMYDIHLTLHLQAYT